MKRLIFCLSVILLTASLLTFPASAQTTRQDLSDIYENLNEYIYPPYYESSPYYEAFTAQMNRLYELLKKQSLSQEDINTAYRNTKKAYTALMQDVFDYSELFDVLDFYNTLDLSLFTEESGDRLITASEAVQKELDSPSLFRTGNGVTMDQYKAVAQEHITNVRTQFATTLSSLAVSEDALDTITANGLMTVVRLYRVSAPAIFTGNTPAARRFRAAANASETLAANKNTAPDRLKDSYVDLTEAYRAMMRECIDFSSVKVQTDLYQSLNSADFSEISWRRYKDNVDLLKEKCDGTFYFYFTANDEKEFIQEQIENHLQTLIKPVESSYKILIPIATYRELYDLCREYRQASATDGLEIKLNRLLSCVKEGDEVLTSETAKPEDFKRSIDSIKAAAEELDLAERFLEQEKENEILHDEKMVRLVITCAIIAFVASLVCACFFSARDLGRLNWKK